MSHLPPNLPTRFPTTGDKRAFTSRLTEMTLDKRVLLHPSSWSMEGKKTPKAPLIPDPKIKERAANPDTYHPKKIFLFAMLCLL
jgi:hypothetical protein